MSGSLFQWSVIAVLVIWFILSVLNQLKWKWFELIRQFDYFSLLPFWTFFAPNPGQTDYHLTFRDKLADGLMTEWKEIEIGAPRYWYCFIWNPEKRSKKVI